MKLRRCPACFAREIDVFLFADEKENAYYCTTCCFTGTPEVVDRFLSEYRRMKYPRISEPHPACERSP